jgi:tape measure domain-containing protein
MANSVDAIIAAEAIKQVENLIAKLTIADAELMKLSQSALAASKNIAGISTPSALDKSVTATKELNAELERQNIVIKALELEIKKLAFAKANNNKVSAEESVNQRILNQNAITHAKSVSNLVGSYQKLDIAHKKALVSAQNIGAEFGLNSKQFKAAASSANILDKQLKEIDSSLGKSQRNVGNYTSAFNGLGSVLSQLGFVGGIAGVVSLGMSAFETSKEIQSLELALRSVTGTEANFADQQAFLNRISDQYGVSLKNLTAQYVSFYVAAKDKLAGKDIQGIFENIAKSGAALGLSNETLSRSFTALNQMLSKGTVASEELRGQLAEALPGSVQAMVKAVQILHPEIKNLNEKGLFEMIKNGKILANEVLPETARQLVIMTGADKAEGIVTLGKLSNQLSNAWVRMISAVNSSDSSGFGIFVKGIVSGITTILDFTGQLFQNEKQLETSFQKIGKNQGLKEYKAVLDNISGTTKEQQKLTKEAILERERENIRVNQSIVASEKKKRDSSTAGDKDSSKLQTASFLSTAKGERALFHLQTKNEEDALVQIGRSAAIIKQIRLDEVSQNIVVSTTKTELTKKEIADQIKAEEDRLKLIASLRKKEIELELATIDVKLNDDTLYYSDRLGSLDQDFVKRSELSKLNYSEELRLAKGNQDAQKIALINFQIENIKLLESYNDKKAGLEKLQLRPITALATSASEKDPSKQLEDQMKKNIKNLQAYGDQLTDTEKRTEALRAATADYLKSFTDDFAGNSGFAETFKIAKGEIAGFGEDFAVTFNAIAESAQETFNFIANASNQNFDRERERLQSQYETSLMFAGGNAATEAKLAEDLEKKKIEISNRENKAKQKQAIFNIAIDTAQGIVSALSTANVPLAVLIGVLGAAQIAVVAAQKIPQYFDGGIHGGGLAMINDAGGSNYVETVVTPDGKVSQYSGRDVVADLPKGTEIFTPDQWKEKELQSMLNSRGVSMTANYNKSSGATAAEIDGVMAKHFKKIQVNNTTFDREGMRSWSESNGNKTIQSNNRVSRTGFKV